ncbi:MAG: calcium-binding protein [Tateyamaria sp.]|uniref:calcium-binding protein n=1 Tax=Tateyamaria sp. TaxID=1929288 RepID=UPI0032A0FF76
MPTAITSGSSTFSITDMGFFFMGEDEVLVASGNGILVNISDVNLFINGQIFADDRGVFSTSSFNNVDITIGTDATVVSGGLGVGIATDFTSLVNYGSITGLETFGVNLEGGADFVTFANFGAVNGDTTGLQIGGSNQFAVNHGSIIGETGVRFGNEESAFVNHGIVTGVTALAGVQSFGILVGFNDDDTFIQNFGTISGGTASISTLDGIDNLFIENHGLLIGDVDLGNGADTYRAGTDGIVVGQILTDEGNDTVRGGDHADDIDGGDDDDQIFARGGEDTILGGSGNDTIGGGDGNDIIDGGVGSDLIWGGNDDDSLTGNGGADVLYGGRGDDTLEGDGGNDQLNGGRDNDQLLGGNGNDILTGGAGEDDLRGGGNADTLSGGSGDDVLTGGNGNDVFVFAGNGGRDTITDFVNGDDQIDLTDFGQFTFASLTANFVVDLHGPNGSSIDFGNGDVLILENLAFGNLEESDFIFF